MRHKTNPKTNRTIIKTPVLDSDRRGQVRPGATAGVPAAQKSIRRKASQVKTDPSLAVQKTQGSRTHAEKKIKAKVRAALVSSARTPAAAAVLKVTKKSRLIEILRNAEGSYIASLSAALGWQSHTTRAALSGLRKAGFRIVTQRSGGEGAGLHYRILADEPEVGSAIGAASGAATGIQR